MVAEQTEKLLDVMDLIPAPIVVVQADRLTFNRALEDRIGYRRQEITCLSDWFRTLYPGAARAAMQTYQHLESNSAGQTLRISCTAKSGAQLLFDLHADQREAGVQVWHLQHIVSAQHEEQQHLAKFSLAQQCLALSDKQSFITQLLDKMPTIVYLKNTSGEYIFVNQYFEKIYSSDRLDIVGKTDYEVFDHNIAEQFIRDDKIVIHEKINITTFDQINYQDGTVDNYQSYKFPIFDANNAVYAIAGICLNITRIKKLEKEKTEIQKQLHQTQKIESIGQLASGVAHDFNNILSGILGYASLLKKQFQTDAAVIKKLDVIIHSTQRGSELTRQLLSFIRGDNTEKTRLDVYLIIEEVVKLLFRSIDRKITVDIQTEPDLCLIEGNSSEIFQTLMNLGINARDAMPAGGKIIYNAKNITMDAGNQHGIAPGNYVEIAVRDTGTGIADEIIDKIFDPFFTTKDLGQGTGLGLSMVYGIVQNHGGEIVVESKNTGTTFKLYLPVYVEKLSADKNFSVTAFRYDNTLYGKRILIVDDEEVMRDLLTDILSEYGVKYFVAEDGKHAIELFQQTTDSVDLVIVDVMMPKMNGVAVYQRIQELQPELATLFISGFSESQPIDELCQLSHVDFIGKPFQTSELIHKLSRLLNLAVIIA